MPDDYASDFTSSGIISVGAIATGVIEQAGDEDWFAADLEAGRLYRITLDSLYAEGITALSDPLFSGIYDATSMDFLGYSNDDSGGDLNSRVTFSPSQTGTYFLSARGYGSHIGSYELGLAEVDLSDDVLATPETLSAVAPNEPVFGTLDYVGDRDWFAAELVTDETYLIELVGTEGDNGVILQEPYFEGVYDADGTLVVGSQGEVGYYGPSRSLFVPDESGTFYLSAASYADSYSYYDVIGDYELRLTPYDLSGEVAGDLSTTATLAVGETQIGSVDFLGSGLYRDSDWFAVELEAGHAYLFGTRESEGSDLYGAMSYIADIFDAEGLRVPYERMASNYVYAENGHRTVFLPEASGTYYIDVTTDYYDQFGSYEISAAELADLGREIPDQVLLSGDDFGFHLTGMNGPDLLVGSDADNRLIGGAGADALLGLGGDDLLATDTRLNADWNPRVEELVYRLFEFALDRAPSLRELQMGVELSYNSVWDFGWAADFVLNSPEFLARWGEMSDAALIDFFYERLRGEGQDDDPGRQMWLDRLTGGSDGYYYYGESRGEIASRFIRSEEYSRTSTEYAIAARLDQSAAYWTDEVFSSYQAVLGRVPDMTGFESWMARMNAGLDLSGLAQRFLRSTEFEAANDGLSDSAFAELVLGNLGMATDAATLEDASARLEAGLSRADFVAVQLLLSDDNGLVEWMRGTGRDDLLDGGAGNDTLFGGEGSDSFVFGPDGGTDMVVDLEPWDVIDLSGFGFSDAAAALDAFRQVDSTVVFEAEGALVRFRETDLSIVDEDMLIL